MTMRYWTADQGYAGVPGTCDYCPERLLVCSECHGHWRSARSACTHCGLGFRCPLHDRYWIAQ